MSDTQEQPQSKQNRDAYDSFFECMTTCYSLEGEDIECVTQCVALHLQGESSIEVSL